MDGCGLGRLLMFLEFLLFRICIRRGRKFCCFFSFDFLLFRRKGNSLVIEELIFSSRFTLRRKGINRVSLKDSLLS